MTSTVEGRGLFGGRPAVVSLRAADGPILLQGAPVGAYARIPSLRTTTIQSSFGRLKTVEHLFAAFGGLGIHAGVAIEVDGDELPMLDGGAARWCRALAELGVPPSPPGLRIVRDAEILVGASIYRFRAAGRGLRVILEWSDARLAAAAEWEGDPSDFAGRIAPARTFVFADEIAKLADAGMSAGHVDPESVVVVDEGGVHSAGRSASWDEPARHKLLDLTGDLFLHGGPPVGRIEAFRPGHEATHEALRRAREMGIVADR